MTAAVIDDQLLGRVLRGRIPAALRRVDLFTTGYWYVRLCQAVLGASERAGVLSGPFVDLPDGLRERALAGLLALPDDIGLVSLRDLAPTIGRLRGRHSLNILSLEALAAASHLGADVYLSAPSARLEDALAQEGRAARFIR